MSARLAIRLGFLAGATLGSYLGVETGSFGLAVFVCAWCLVTCVVVGAICKSVAAAKHPLPRHRAF